MEAWHLWMIAAISLSLLEVFTGVSGFLILCFALGSLASAAAAFLGFGLPLQLLLFSLVSIGAIFGLRPFFQSRFARASRVVKTNADALIGKVGVVSERIERHPHGGRALVEGEDWWAVSQDDAPVESGERVTVIQVDGSKLVVARM